ncbi:MAG: hypothetical protein NTX50_13445 [Candidatus Sumerlaeota bacterium]|nr:hypothetical protein [Candidatus Sumerlaeota bacterium]
MLSHASCLASSLSSSLAALFIAIISVSPCASRAAAPDSVIVTSAAQLLDESLTLLAEKSSDKDTQYYEKGVWHLVNLDKAWAVQGGPGSAAAVLWKWRAQRRATLDAATLARQDWLHRVAVETFDHSLKDITNPDGTLRNMNTVELIFFSLELANTLLELGDSLDAATHQRWLDALTSHVLFMIKDGGLPNPEAKGWKATDGWTTNGNVELCEAELVYMMWLLTGDQKYKSLFETQWKHTLQPDPQRWKGYGLFYIKEPTKEDGSDGAAYIAEAEQEPGFDREYTLFQLTIANRSRRFSCPVG